MQAYRVLVDMEVLADDDDGAVEAVKSLVQADADTFIEMEILSTREVVRE